MKRFENFTSEDLKKFRDEIVLNSLYTSDFNNSFSISAKSAQEFFDGFMSYLDELATEDGYIDDIDAIFERDTIENLVDWFYCYDDFSWVEYDIDFYDNSTREIFEDGDVLGPIADVRDALSKAFGEDVNCYDDRIDDGIDDEDCEDEYLMCMCLEVVNKAVTIRIYYGNNTRVIGDIDISEN